MASVVEDYMADKLFSVFGYGAYLETSKPEASQRFPINLNDANPYCEKVDGEPYAVRVVWVETATLIFIIIILRAFRCAERLSCVCTAIAF